MELDNAPPDRRAVFNCSSCPISTQEIRRCREERSDFTAQDSVIFPMYVTKGGDMYGYCPGKATWDDTAAFVYQALVITAETGIMLEDGPISKQPGWWVDLLAWFLPYYSDSKFYSRASRIMGEYNSTNADQKIKKGSKSGRNNG